jgi:hypothetical protein
VIAGFREGRYIPAGASARGEWAPGGPKLPSGDAYATSKQCHLATVLVFAREMPRLRFNAVEPSFSPGTNLGRDANAFLRLLGKYVLAPLAPFIRYWSNPKTAAQVITGVLTGNSGRTGVYYDERADWERFHARARPGMQRTRGRRDPRLAGAGPRLTSTRWRRAGRTETPVRSTPELTALPAVNLRASPGAARQRPGR